MTDRASMHRTQQTYSPMSKAVISIISPQNHHATTAIISTRTTAKLSCETSQTPIGVFVAAMRRFLTLAVATCNFLPPSSSALYRPSTVSSLSVCFAVSSPPTTIPITPDKKKQRIAVAMYTTNEEDQREAAKLKARLEDNKSSSSGLSADATATTGPIPNVTMAEGAHKYVLISALLPGGGQRQHFVVSRRHAAYHRNAAEPMVEALEQNGYSSISILGGGRISLDSAAKTIAIYGFSYGFGLVSKTNTTIRV
jgi:Janus/Ocnus family (Ocnus)